MGNVDKFTAPFLDWQVLYKWNNVNVLSIKDLITQMVAWQRNRYLDPGVWEHFRSRINPEVLPDDISALQLAPPTGQSAVLSYMVNIFVRFNIYYNKKKIDPAAVPANLQSELYPPPIRQILVQI